MDTLCDKRKCVINVLTSNPVRNKLQLCDECPEDLKTTYPVRNKLQLRRCPNH